MLRRFTYIFLLIYTDFIFEKQKKKNLLKRFTYIFLLIYTLNAPKINDLYMTKKVILKKKKRKQQ